MRSAAAAPTVRQVLERGRGNAPEHLLPFELYKTAAAELSRLHKRYRYHGYVRLSNFKVDEVTGAVTLTNFMFCRSLYPGTLYELSFKILAEEKRKLLNLFSAYMTADEITKVEL